MISLTFLAAVALIAATMTTAQVLLPLAPDCTVSLGAAFGNQMVNLSGLVPQSHMIATSYGDVQVPAQWGVDVCATSGRSPVVPRGVLPCAPAVVAGAPVFLGLFGTIACEGVLTQRVPTVQFWQRVPSSPIFNVPFNATGLQLSFASDPRTSVSGASWMATVLLICDPSVPEGRLVVNGDAAISGNNATNLTMQLAFTTRAACPSTATQAPSSLSPSSMPTSSVPPSAPPTAPSSLPSPPPITGTPTPVTVAPPIAPCVVLGPGGSQFNFTGTPTLVTQLNLQYGNSVSQHVWVVNLCAPVPSVPAGKRPCNRTIISGFLLEFAGYPADACESVFSELIQPLTAISDNSGVRLVAHDPVRRSTAVVTVHCGSSAALAPAFNVRASGPSSNLTYQLSFVSSAACSSATTPSTPASTATSPPVAPTTLAPPPVPSGSSSGGAPTEGPRDDATVERKTMIIAAAVSGAAALLVGGAGGFLAGSRRKRIVGGYGHDLSEHLRDAQ